MDMFLLARSMGGLSVVLSLLAFALWVVRRHDIRLPGRVGGARRSRLGIIERITLDPKRSLLLVRHDEREHLILLTPEGHLVIEEQAQEELKKSATPPMSTAPAEETIPTTASVAPLSPAPYAPPSPCPQRPEGQPMHDPVPSRPLHIRPEWARWIGEGSSFCEMVDA